MPLDLPIMPYSALENDAYAAKYELFKTDNRVFARYHYEIHSRAGKLLASGITNGEGSTDYVSTQLPEGVKAYKSIMRKSERITESWQDKVATATAKAAKRQAPSSNS